MADENSYKNITSEEYRSLRRLIIASCVGMGICVAGFFIANKAVDFYVLDQAKKELKKKERDWEIKLDAVPAQMKHNLESIASKYIQKYYPDIDTFLPFEEQWLIFCRRLTDEGKNELKREVKAELKSELEKITDEDIRIYAERFFGTVLSDKK